MKREHWISCNTCLRDQEDQGSSLRASSGGMMGDGKGRHRLHRWWCRRLSTDKNRWANEGEISSYEQKTRKGNMAMFLFSYCLSITRHSRGEKKEMYSCASATLLPLLSLHHHRRCCFLSEVIVKRMFKLDNLLHYSHSLESVHMWMPLYYVPFHVRGCIYTMVLLFEMYF